MAFNKIVKNTETITTIEAMFHETKAKQIAGPWAWQADIWREYENNHKDNKDVAIHLPTGSGKTLIGIALGEWRRKKYNERVIFLCPTKQLVNQVANQSLNQYGIHVQAFTGSNRNYSAEQKRKYIQNECVSIIPYSSLFNVNPYFDEADVIILDDAHVSENYVASMWSLVIDKEDSPHRYADLLLTLDSCREQQVSRSQDDPNKSWIEMVPGRVLLKHRALLTSKLDAIVSNTDMTYAWSLIRDKLVNCQ